MNGLCEPFSIVLSTEAPRRELSRRERKALRRTMQEAEAAMRGGAFTQEVREDISVEEMRAAHAALKDFIVQYEVAHVMKGFMTVPVSMRRHIAIAYAALDAFMSSGKLKVKK